MGNKGEILVAEDDPVLREVYIKKFKLNGYDIRTAADGEEAIKLIEEQAPDALILDINMPIMNGFAVLSRFPKQQRDFPVILLTNLADDSTRQKGTDLGADDFFIKSQMTLKTLMDMVDNLMASRYQ